MQPGTREKKRRLPGGHVRALRADWPGPQYAGCPRSPPQVAGTFGIESAAFRGGRPGNRTNYYTFTGAFGSCYSCCSILPFFVLVPSGACDKLVDTKRLLVPN
jgi:hypothetical protein